MTTLSYWFWLESLLCLVLAWLVYNCRKLVETLLIALSMLSRHDITTMHCSQTAVNWLQRTLARSYLPLTVRDHVWTFFFSTISRIPSYSPLTCDITHLAQWWLSITLLLPASFHSCEQTCLQQAISWYIGSRNSTISRTDYKHVSRLDIILFWQPLLNILFYSSWYRLCCEKRSIFITVYLVYVS